MCSSDLGYFFTFPSRYYALSVTNQYLALEGGPPGFKRRFTCAVLLGILLGPELISSTGLSPSMAVLSNTFFYKFKVPR